MMWEVQNLKQNLSKSCLHNQKIYMESGCMTGMENVFGSQMNFWNQKM